MGIIGAVAWKCPAETGVIEALVSLNGRSRLWRYTRVNAFAASLLLALKSIWRNSRLTTWIAVICSGALDGSATTRTLS